MKITYLGHSGFLVEMDDACFLFDYYKGAFPDMDEKKKLFVFVSHAHYDHYNKAVFDLRGRFAKTRYILSSDIRGKENDTSTVDGEQGGDTVFMKPCEERELLGCRVRTLRSNDEGVAFLIQYHGKTLYHAGDLNWWHWEGESDKFNTVMRRSYQSEINKLEKESIDAAFVPVDPRLGEQYVWGLDCFMKRTQTKCVFPMHFWGNYEVFDRLMLEKCTEDYKDKIMKIEREGQSFSL
ncbi:MAG TPA: MBL fold metallo-hydrolase [Candidatus Mediterraneibacter merdavium]|nr:MBL fold metallo-hydrolase [Candidatus Mediterraneibacter merdavium]